MYKIINRHVYEIASGENITLCDIVADASTDLPDADDQALYKIAFGSFAFSIADKCFYCLNSSGTWTAVDINTSDFYTKAEIDAFLLTINTTLNKDRAALVELVDGEAKNLIQVSATSTTTAGIVYTVSNSIITLESGTAANNPSLIGVASTITIPKGNYVLSGCPSGGGDSSYRLDMRIQGTSTVLAIDNGESAEVTLASDTICSFYIRLIGNYQVSTPLTFKPMLCTKAAWDISHEYQPYRPSYQELYDRVVALENNP